MSKYSGTPSRAASCLVMKCKTNMPGKEDECCLHDDDSKICIFSFVYIAFSITSDLFAALVNRQDANEFLDSLKIKKQEKKMDKKRQDETLKR